MLPDLVSLQLFQRAVELRSLSRAAALCHLSLSAASRRIAALEHHFHTPLLERTHNGVSPTPAGEALAGHAQTLMRDVDLMQGDLSDYARGTVGRVRLFVNTSALSQDLPDRLAHWTALHPDIKVDVQEVRSGRIVDAVREGLADIGIVTTAPVPDLRFEPYGHDRLCVVVSQQHPLKARALSFEALLAHEFVGLDNSAALTRAMKQAAEAAGQFLRLRIQVQSFEGVCRLVAAGQGIAVLPEGAVKAFRLPLKLRFIRLTDAWADRPMHACVKPGVLQAPTRRLLQFLTGVEHTGA
jgi:DNA-binding transcriptional LysR family regulator